MNKKYLLYCIPIVISFFFTILFYNQNSTKVDIVNSRISTSSNYNSLDINIIANQSHISNYEKFTYDIIQHCKKNDFQNVHFSYDIKGYPNTLSGTVYLNEKNYYDSKPCFSFIYQSTDNSHTILDDSSHFKLTIDSSR